MNLMPVKITGNGLRHKLELDGHDISNDVTGFRIEYEAGDVIILHLDLAVSEGIEDKVYVHLGEETAKILEKAGWTRPPGGER